MLDLRNICCMELMKEFEDNHFDLAICDPPYGIGAAKEKPHNGWADWGIKQWDNEAPDEAYFKELIRVSKNQIIWGANHFIERMPKQNTPCWLIWDKGQRDFSGQSELLIAFLKWYRVEQPITCDHNAIIEKYLKAINSH